MGQDSHGKNLEERERLGAEGSTASVHRLPYMAAVHRRVGELKPALELARDAVEQTRAAGLARVGLPAELELARVLLELEGPSSDAFIEARASATALIAKTGARAFEPFVNELDAECARRLDDTAAQHQQLLEAQRKFIEMGAGGHAKRIAQELEALSE